MDKYVMNHYGKKPPFASFLPGIAGIHGIPIWCYYVNRGQGVVSFGVSDKDHPIMEFLPAHRAYTRVKQTGFRTFLKLQAAKPEKSAGPVIYEAFFHDENAAMEIGMNTLAIKEELQPFPNAKLSIEVTYFVLPEEPLGALVRLVRLTNTGDQPIDVEMLDGMPEVVPYGVTDWTLKNMLQTGKAWMQVENAETGTPFYRVRASMEDTADVQEVEGGAFASAFTPEGGRLPVITDPQVIFSYDLSLQHPIYFREHGLNGVLKARQQRSNLFPCAFFAAAASLKPGESLCLNELIGQAENQEKLSQYLARPLPADYFDEKLQEAVGLTAQLTDRINTKTADPLFDAYARYTYMDNVLRGGQPVPAGNTCDAGAAPKAGEGKTLYVYSRKHGDLERDYNYFSMLPEYYSQGNGAYRDVNQNRRSDTFFNPWVARYNLRSFFELIQIDGCNPLSVDMQRFALENPDAFLKGHPGLPEDMKALLKKPFTPGQLYSLLSEHSSDPDQLFNEILTCSIERVEAHFGEGYWCDHWTYNLDLVEEYLAIWPDQLENLLTEPVYGYYQAETMIRPRRQRYVKTKNGIRQYHALLEGDELLEKTGGAPIPAGGRLKDRSGQEVKSTLLEKLILLCAVKFAALDPCAMGVEMEGGKPGWYDALNGLPGLLGSSMCETFELERLLDLTIHLLEKLQQGAQEVRMLQELDELLKALSQIAAETLPQLQNDGPYVSFWERINDAKEQYRDKTFMGVSGERAQYDGNSLQALALRLRSLQSVVNQGILRSRKAGVFEQDQLDVPTYFYYEVTSFEELPDGIRPTGFIQHTMPAFLEGPVHLLKLGENLVNKRDVYEKVKRSNLFDEKLQMYRVNAPLTNASYEIGRCHAFTPGWLEHASIWLHMEYKYLLETLKAGLYPEFFRDLKTCLIPFLDPEVYGRSPLENSSFLASSLNPNEDFHGRGFVARLSGSTAEFLSIWRRMFFGEQLFFVQDQQLFFRLAPAIPAYLIPEDLQVSAMLLGRTNVTYQLAKKEDLIPGSYQINEIKASMDDGTVFTVQGDVLGPAEAALLRDGKIVKMIVSVQ
ncbi:MAG: hypothetical protein J6P72_10405 [Firmicutes bacterium]|nr:hypothetical protein [Bacillota bacterium]